MVTVPGDIQLRKGNSVSGTHHTSVQARKTEKAAHPPAPAEDALLPDQPVSTVQRALGLPGTPRLPGALTPTQVLQLQRTIGNRGVARYIGRTQPAPMPPGSIQRMLDANKYSPTALKAGGLKAHFKLIGKTSFGKLNVALGNYFASANVTEEYVNLNKVMAAAADYQGSSERGKTHKGKQKAREDAKQQLVADLVTDGQAELDNLKANVDPGLMQHLIGSDAETAVMVLANKVATVMGITVNDLKDMEPEDLKTDYIERIYLEYSMKRKAMQDTGERGVVMDLIEQSMSTSVLAPIDATKLGPGDAKDLYDLIQASGITDPTTYRAGKAPKFMRGGSTDEQVQPDVEGWSAQNAMQVSGNKDFRDKIKALIDIIKLVPVGKKMLQELGAGPEVDEDMKHDDAKTSVVNISPPAISSVTRRDQTTGQFMYSASAGSTSVVVDPDNPFVGEDVTKGVAEPWRIRHAAIGLFHELIHAYLYKIGGEEFESAEDPEKKMTIGSQGGLAEVRITGVPYEMDEKGHKYTFPFDNPEYNYISENTFRREFAAAQGLEEVYLRPSYGNEPGQKPLGLGPTSLKND